MAVINFFADLDFSGDAAVFAAIASRFRAASLALGLLAPTSTQYVMSSNPTYRELEYRVGRFGEYS